MIIIREAKLSDKDDLGLLIKVSTFSQFEYENAVKFNDQLIQHDIAILQKWIASQGTINAPENTDVNGTLSFHLQILT